MLSEKLFEISNVNCLNSDSYDNLFTKIFSISVVIGKLFNLLALWIGISGRGESPNHTPSSLPLAHAFKEVLTYLEQPSALLYHQYFGRTEMRHR